MTDYSMIIHNFLKLWISENKFKTATVIAPGSQWASLTVEIEKFVTIDAVYDKDPGLIDLPYTNKDVIFDDVEINSDAIITFHGERLFPPTRLFKGNHFFMIRELDDHKNCTTLKTLTHELSFMEMSKHGPWCVFTGEVKNVEPVHIPVYSSLQDRAG